MVEAQGANLAWIHNVQTRPLRAALLREMILSGLSPALARRIAEAVPDDFSADEARRWLAQALARNLRCTGADSDPFERGGIFALVGPTGVGKTTTAAKLAACCVVRHGAGSLGLISSDHYRIGAQDQLRIYGSILGVAVHAVHEPRASVRARCPVRKRLVIIDSSASASATARRRAEGAVRSEKISRCCFRPPARPKRSKKCSLRRGPARGAILNKTDEAVSLGARRLRHPPSPATQPRHQRAACGRHPVAQAA